MLFKHTVQLTLDNMTSPHRRFNMYTTTPEDDELGLITEAAEMVESAIIDLTIIASTTISLPYIEERADLLFEMMDEYSETQENECEIYEISSAETD